MDGNFAAAIDVIIDPRRATQGTDKTIAELDRIIRHGNRASAANDNMAGSFDRAGRSMAGAASQGGAISKVLDDITGRAAGATPAVGGLIANLTRMGPMAAVVGGVALAIGAVGTAAIKAAAQTQSWLAQIETITKSSEKAKETYAALVNFGNSTPFDTGQSVQAFVKLRQMGLAATEERMRSFGNTASATGKSLNQMIEAVADAGTGEFERLKEFGIKSKVEGDKVAFTFQGVKTSVENNAVAITKYLTDIGNNQFGGAMAKQMATLNGAFAGFGDSMRGMLSQIGEGQLGSAVQDIINRISQGITAITPLMASIGNAVGGIVSGVGAVIDGVANMWSGFGYGEAAIGILDGLTIGFNLIGQGAEVFGDIAGAVFGAVGGLASGVSEMIRSSFGGMLGDLTSGFDNGGRSWSNSIVGILRAVKAVAQLMPQLFSIAITDVMAMFRTLGTAVGQFMTGNFNAFEGITAKVKADFASTKKAALAVGRIGNAVYGDTKGADAAIDRLLGKRGGAKLDTGVDAKIDKPGSKDKKGAGGKSEAEKLAEKIDDFWKKLEGDSKDAEATYKALGAAADAGKNLAIASADTAKQLEFQRLAGRDITAQERERISNSLQTQRTNKFLSDALLASEQRKYDIAEQTALLEGKKKGLTDQQLEVEKSVLKLRTDAQKAGLDLTNATYKAAEDKLRTDLSGVEAIKNQNKLLDEQKEKYKALVEAGKDVAARYSPSADLSKQQADLKKERSQLDAWYLENKNNDNREQIERQYREAVQGISRAATEATNHFKTRWIDAIDVIANNFSGKFGGVIQGLADALYNLRNMGGSNDNSLFGGIAGLFGGKVLGSYKDSAVNNGADLTSALSNPLKSLSDGFGDFTKMFKDPGQSGFGAILGKGLAKAGAGYEMGSAIGGLGEALGLKGFGTGAKIGGSIGGLFGPIGGIIGSVGGGLLGSLFHKPKYGTASLTGPGGAVVTGNKAAYSKAASGAAGSVQEGLAKLAAELGGAVGEYSLAIGQWDGKWRVNTNATTKQLHSNNFKTGPGGTLTDFGKDGMADAIAFAIQDAIKDGAITGLSPMIQKALSTLGADAAIQFAKDWTAAMADYKSLIDPVGAAIDAIIKPLDNLRATMTKVGASTEDMAKFEDYRSKKLQAALKEQTSSFRDILDQLNGSAGGFSDLSILTSDLAKLETFRADLAAGRSVDQSAFSDLANNIIGSAGNVYGTQTQDYQDIVNLLKNTTTNALDSATRSFNAAAGNNADITNAMKVQTDAYVAGQNTTNDLLAKQNKLLEENNALLRQQANTGSGLMVENARMVADW